MRRSPPSPATCRAASRPIPGRRSTRCHAFDLTVTFGALKPAHRLHPAMHKCGRRGARRHRHRGETASGTRSARPSFRRSIPAGTNMTAGWSMRLPARCPARSRWRRRRRPGRARAMSASARRGRSTGLPSAVVQVDTAEVNDPRIGCLLVGPGLGDIPQVLTLALTSQAPKVIDADAIGLLGDPERLRGQDAIVTPHEGEFGKLFGDIAGREVGAGAGGGRAVAARWWSSRARTRWSRRPTGGSASLRRRRPGWRARGPATCSPG